MHSGEGIQGCSIYTGTAGVAYMFLRLAESLQYTQQKMADHPDQVFAKLDATCLLNRAEEYGHWAKHLSHCGKHKKVQNSLALLEASCLEQSSCCNTYVMHDSWLIICIMKGADASSFTKPYKQADIT